MKRIDGKNITGVGPHYEQIGVRLDDGSYLFLSYKDLQAILHEFIFDVEMKKTRKWIHPVRPDVDLLYYQDRYPEQDGN